VILIDDSVAPCRLHPLGLGSLSESRGGPVFEVGRRVFTRLERFLKLEGYLDPAESDAPEA